MRQQHHLSIIIFTLTILLTFTSSSKEAADDVQGCSIVGISLRNCLTSNPTSLASCCSTLNRAVQAGFYCMCALFGQKSSGIALFRTEIAITFSSCYISVPPLTDCHVLEPNPLITTTPSSAVPQLNQTRSDPLPPKIDDNSSESETNATLTSNSASDQLIIPDLADDHPFQSSSVKKNIKFCLRISSMVALLAHIIW